ncbi:hypothetical protein CIL05_11125 [Virgibacillus profundi]|uniref:Uncharacterized protein n=1 Tax=Virgibacillus profundi TaxID=2024555 RepID=A0A2A2ICV4_9BACI|nr:hypothetical protein [Virgibacillus profundi]PAV29412.1 hypothetical protein CIL05_11125 [Virgibacillus profundi]PXY53582.1 hypothetical protein CIT14_11235 [Virgibacillus profundi]
MKSYIRLFIFISILICLIIPQSVSAEENIDISIEYGIDGKVQIGKGFPMTITLTNQSEDLSGDLVIFSNPNYSTQGNIVVPVELPKGEEKKIKVSVPGHGDNFYYQQQQSNKDSFIRFYKGGWEEGKELKLSSDKKFNPGFFPENRLVMGVLSDSPDSLNFLKLTKYNAEAIEFITLEEDDLSNDAIGLEMFDVLLINDYNLSNISVEKQKAVKNWIRSGGHLMIGSNPGLSQQLGEINELSLLHINDQTSFDDLNFLSTAEDEQTPSFSKVEIVTGDVVENSKVQYAEDSLPMVLNKSFGLGEVTQFAFNVGSQTLSTWEPYSVWWGDVLQKTVDKDIHGQQRYMMEDLSNQMGNIVNAFPSSFLPLTVLIVLFVIYLAFLIPGLYFILKKFDKRESSWWIIPTVALITTICIFIVGAKDRIAGSQTNDISVLAIDDTGLASGYGAVSILTNSGGDYALTVKPKGFNPFPLSNDFRYDDMKLDYAMIEKGQEQTKLTFNDVEYWSIRSAAGDIQSIDMGKLTSDLKIENQQLVGKVNSSLSLDLDEAFLLSGGKAYSLGGINAGESTDVSLELDKSDTLVSAPRSTVISSVFPGASNSVYGSGGGPANQEGLSDWKKQELLNIMLNHKIHQSNLNQPLIAGFTNDSMINVEMDKKQADSTSLTLITQAVEVIPSLDGDFTLTEKTLQTDFSVLEGTNANILHNGMVEGDNFVAVEAGKYQLTYRLPDQIKKDDLNINKLELNLPQTSSAAFSIFNAEKDKFLPLDDRSFTVEENANEFLSEDGSIVIVFEKANMDNPEVRVPAISLEGAYKN